MENISGAPANRLLKEKSPYLLQHAYNPVDWYPWGAEAFEAARQQDKPILVSIGYSTCHWCHVMEHESYEDPAVAALMNRYLINVKVDREERPDVDKIYMTAVSAMTGQGGWPLNVFVTPDLEPIFGGTYFPPAAKWGSPAWRDVVTQIGEAWKKSADNEKMRGGAKHIMEALKQFTSAARVPVDVDATMLDLGFKALEASYDASYGGFGQAPKFPMPVYHNFLLRYYARTKNQEALKISVATLKAMARGGIYDQLGGGFARYSTDDRWHVPHFEKMLYDNAQLAVNYLEAYQITRDEEFRRIAQETLAYLQRDMAHPEGGFYSAEDADSFPAPDAAEKKEGAFYVWSKQEILDLLGPLEGPRVCAALGVDTNGNALHDPHGEFSGKNIVYRADPTADLGKSAGVLLAARNKRPRPHVDDKIISAWNGLAISACAKAYQVLGEKASLTSGQRAANFLKTHLYDAETQTLFRRWRDGQRQEFGIADDYAFVIQGLIDLFESDFDPQWLDWAVTLMDSMTQRFYDPDAGGHFMTAVGQDKHLILRIKEDTDNVEPSASSIATLNLLRLSQYMGRADYAEMAQETLNNFSAVMRDSPRAVPQMLAALSFTLNDPIQIVISGKVNAPETDAMLAVLRNRFLPAITVMFADGANVQEFLSKNLNFLKELRPANGKTTAYLCVHRACKQPTSDPEVFKALLEAL